MNNIDRAMREIAPNNYTIKGEPKMKGNWPNTFWTRAALWLGTAALVAALIYAWPEPRHSDTLTVSDGFGGLK